MTPPIVDPSVKNNMFVPVAVKCVELNPDNFSSTSLYRVHCQGSKKVPTSGLGQVDFLAGQVTFKACLSNG